ncbi:hypothetical protein ACIOWI_17310 [Streptomyces sp. NPDC087659]|uniref:hypothetical protein n=1 Tax=unclassified Streptomyces TaxID=2593676 RepID=UPI003331F006
MSKKSREPSHGEGPSRFKGQDQHGWAEDVDDTAQDNPSGHRSFHPDTYAGGSKKSRRPTEEEKAASLEGTTVESDSRRGEDQGGKQGQKGMRDTGPRGKSQRPSGAKSSSAFSGVDPQDPDTPHSGR